MLPALRERVSTTGVFHRRARIGDRGATLVEYAVLVSVLVVATGTSANAARTASRSKAPLRRFRRCCRVRRRVPRGPGVGAVRPVIST